MYREALPPAPTGGTARRGAPPLRARRGPWKVPAARRAMAEAPRVPRFTRPREVTSETEETSTTVESRFPRFRNRGPLSPRGFPRRSAGAPSLPWARQTRSRHDRGEEGAAEERRRRPGVRRRVRGVRQRRCGSSSRARRDLDPVRPRDLVGLASSLPLSDRPRPANVSDRQSGAPRKRTPRMSSSGRRTGTTPTRTTTSHAS